MLGSKWKVIGLLLWLAFRIAVRHPLPFAVVMVREVVESVSRTDASACARRTP